MQLMSHSACETFLTIYCRCLRIVRLADEGAVEAADGQLRRVGPVDGNAEHAVFFLQEHVGDDISRRPARG